MSLLSDAAVLLAVAVEKLDRASCDLAAARAAHALDAVNAALAGETPGLGSDRP